MSDFILLSDEERRKFAAYLLQTATSNLGLADQAAKIRAGALIVEKLKREAAAMTIVARELLATETMSAGGPET